MGMAGSGDPRLRIPDAPGMDHPLHRRNSPPVVRGCGWRRGSARWPASGPRTTPRVWQRMPNLRPLVKYGFAHTTLARVHLAEGRPEEAVELLTRLLVVAEAGGWMGDVIEILALQALALQAQGATMHTHHHPRARAGAGRARGVCAHLRGRRRADGGPFSAERRA